MISDSFWSPLVLRNIPGSGEKHASNRSLEYTHQMLQMINEVIMCPTSCQVSTDLLQSFIDCRLVAVGQMSSF